MVLTIFLARLSLKDIDDVTDIQTGDTFQAFLANDDLGDSLDSVEALMKKHDDFEKSLAAQEEKIKALDEFASKLIENEHYAADEVAARRDAVSTMTGE